MSEKKSKSNTKRYYHADGYTYDEYSPGVTSRNFTDSVRRKLKLEKMKLGAVGPERQQDYLKRLKTESEYIEKNKDLRVLDTSKNKARGTQSSTTRRVIK